jgi:hypothetical protein
MAQQARRRGRTRSFGDTAEQVAQGLGWFSIGLGLVELVAPHRITRALGMHGQENLVSGYGLREIGTGIGILTAKDPTPWIWGRVGGDALDLGTLAPALSGHNRRRGGAGLAFAAVLGVTVLDLACGVVLHNRAKQRAIRHPDYGDRRGLPRPPEQMRGAARDFEVPRDFRIPEPLRPWAA